MFVRIVYYTYACTVRKEKNIENIQKLVDNYLTLHMQQKKILEMQDVAQGKSTVFIKKNAPESIYYLKDNLQRHLYYN